MEISKCFKIGYIAKTHGLKGEVTMALGPECPDLEDVKSIFIQLSDQLVPFFIESVSAKGNKAYIKLEDVTSPEKASSLKGHSVFLQKNARPKLIRGEFYSDEVIGFEVTDSEKGLLGTVSDVLEGGSNRFLVVIHHEKEVLIPLNGPFVMSLNKTRKKIAVELPDGFLDI